MSERAIPSIHGRDHVPGGPDPVPGFGMYEIKVFEDVNVVTVGDGKFWWPIPSDLDGADIVYVDAGVSVASTSGSVQIQIRHFEGGPDGANADILSTVLNIEPNEYNAGDSGTPAVIGGGVWPIAYKDWLRIDVVGAGVGAMGLAVMLGVTPAPLGTITLNGAQGPPGGITAWRSQWQTATDYDTGDAVTNNGSSYVALVDHTSGATSEPGVGANWEDFWMVLSAAQGTSSFQLPMNGGNYALTPGPKAPLSVPFACTIVEATLLADVAGSVVVDLWKDTYGNYPPTDADSITGSSPPTLSTAIKTTDTVLSGWTTALAAGDTIIPHIDSVAGITRLTLALKVTRI